MEQQRGLVVKVAPLPLHPLMRALEELHRLATARAPLHAPTHPPLRSGELLLRCVVVARIVDSLPVSCDAAVRAGG
jgi:hypothetical protein